MLFNTVMFDILSRNFSKKSSFGITDPEAYYYTTGTLNGLHETERFVRFGLVFNFPRYSDFLAWRIGLLFIFATAK